MPSCILYIPADVVTSEQRLRPNDIVIAASSGSVKVVGKAAQLRTPWEGTFGAFCAVFRPGPRVDPRYVAWFMASPGYRERVSALAAGININNLKREHLLTMPLPLPPREEQERIVRSLDTLIGELDNGAEDFSRALAGLGQYRSACLAAAFGGPCRKLDELAAIQSGIAKGRPAGDDLIEMPYIRTANVQALRLDLGEIKTLQVTPQQREKHTLQPDDVLVLEGGDADKVGRGWIWQGEVENCLHQNHVFAVRPDARLLVPRYLAYYVNAPQARAYFLSVAKQTTNLASINKSNLRNLPVPVPTLQEQRSQVAALDQQLSATADMEACLRAQLEDAGLLRRSVLRAGVDGQLAPAELAAA